MGCVWLFNYPFSLLASFCEQAGTGNSTMTHHNDILEQNNCYSKYCTFLWNSEHLGEVRTKFASKYESCFIEFNIK